MGIGISGCVNTSLSRRIEREQSETSTPAHCLRLGINKSIALGYDGRHGNRRPIRALSHSPSLSFSPPSVSLRLSPSVSLPRPFPSSPSFLRHPPLPASPLRPPQFISVPLRSSNTHTLCSSLAFSLSSTLFSLAPFRTPHLRDVLFLPFPRLPPFLLFLQPSAGSSKILVRSTQICSRDEALKLASPRNLVTITAI